MNNKPLSFIVPRLRLRLRLRPTSTPWPKRTKKPNTQTFDLLVRFLTYLVFSVLILNELKLAQIHETV